MAHRDTDFDVVVIGGGHAGCEAALASARLGCRTVLITSSLDTIAAMPCNCSIGGPGKAHLVRELDALGGEMGRAIDRTFTHIRLLNASKGPAVQALRAQADKALYRQTMKSTLENQRGLLLRQDTAAKILVSGGVIRGIVGLSGITYSARAVVVATGTFLNGQVHMGEVTYPAGRAGEPSTVHLAQALRELGFTLRRFKTGTVPRVLLESIDLEEVSIQPSSARPLRFSYDPMPRPERPLLPCLITATTEATHDLLRRNAHRSALWSGRITGVGPRYCPSIEAKLQRFPDRRSHLVFLEQEGWDTREVYVQGLSNSMPADVQLEMLRTVPGLRRCEMTRPGYAIEYDSVDAMALDSHLAYPAVPGLFLAGQINGTSGYEEAAAQGLLAGINAAAYVLGRPPLRLQRTDGYLGVLVDDITARGTDEPYRMLTARAEYRLLFGQDTAWYRLLPHAEQVGLVSPERLERIRAEREQTEATLEARELATQPARVRRSRISPQLAAHLHALRTNEPYVSREARRARRIQALRALPVPPGLDFTQLPLRTEAKERLQAAAPRDLAEVAAVPGLTPADLATVHAALLRAREMCPARGENEEPHGCFT